MTRASNRIRLSLLSAGFVVLSGAVAAAPAALDPSLPSIFIAGDSTAADGVPNAIGWGKHLPRFFDLTKINVVNEARGGRSSRTFVAEELWDHLLDQVKKNDYVLIQFGQNDGAEINGERIARGSLPGLGDETQEIDNRVTGLHETVHTFGWYMRKMIRETQQKGAMPILCSLTVRNIWKEGRVERGSGQYSVWTRELAESEKVAFVDLTNQVADRYEQMGADSVKPLFPRDIVHTSEDGADLNAQYIVAGLKALRENAIIKTFSAAGRNVEIAAPNAVLMPHLKRPSAATAREDFLHWLNLPDPADPKLPSLYLIGDSTVRNGRGDGIDGLGQWGWGDPLTAYFDPGKINVVNRAVGGTGVRTFMKEGYWDKVLALLKPGDVVIMQFGHNDNGPNAPLSGIGEETADRAGETIHTWGWYLRKYIADARAHAAIPIVCTLIPRNQWQDSKIVRPVNSHADWARQVARAERAPLLDLYDRIAQRYDPMGEAAVTALFADKRVHTSRTGAELNASIVVEALKALPEDPVAEYLRPGPATIW
ncbi:MAG TPA: rhamnogalacturonan acetylesterase [Candidatus Limnocylindrales bacterium]|nr:rhamnogalacturonan acetylesterase [Candidatus Limnocylindrales bacterium]